MAEKELRFYKRKELIELLYQSERKNADLARQLEEEQDKSRKLNEALKQRRLEVQEAGNLADAVLKVNGVCEAAQKAADDYLLNIKALSEEQDRICSERETKSRTDANQLIKEASRKCEAMQKKTEEECWQMEEQTKRKCETIKKQARTEVESYWEELKGRLESFYEAHQGMKEILAMYHTDIPDVDEMPDEDLNADVDEEQTE